MLAYVCLFGWVCIESRTKSQRTKSPAATIPSSYPKHWKHFDNIIQQVNQQIQLVNRNFIINEILFSSLLFIAHYLVDVIFGRYLCNYCYYSHTYYFFHVFFFCCFFVEVDIILGSRGNNLHERKCIVLLSFKTEALIVKSKQEIIP